MSKPAVKHNINITHTQKCQNQITKNKNGITTFLLNPCQTFRVVRRGCKQGVGHWHHNSWKRKLLAADLFISCSLQPNASVSGVHGAASQVLSVLWVCGAGGCGCGLCVGPTARLAALLLAAVLLPVLLMVMCLVFSVCIVHVAACG